MPINKALAPTSLQIGDQAVNSYKCTYILHFLIYLIIIFWFLPSQGICFTSNANKDIKKSLLRKSNKKASYTTVWKLI